MRFETGPNTHPELVASLGSLYWNAFISWQQRDSTVGTLQIPDDMVNVFIPERILELSENPFAVGVRILQRYPEIPSHQDSIRVMIVETLPQNLTDPEVFARWTAISRPQTREGFYDMPIEVPEGIHYKHYQYDSLVQSGVIGFNDMVWLDYSADVPAGYPSVVQTRNFFDRPDVHGRGIAKGFYGRLEAILKQLEFAYLTGSIASPRPFFFMRNRIAYRWLDSRVRAELPPINGEAQNRYYVRILNR